VLWVVQVVHCVLAYLRTLDHDLLTGLKQFDHVSSCYTSENSRQHSVPCRQINYSDDGSVVEFYFWMHFVFAYKSYIIWSYNHDCITIMPENIQTRYTSIRVDFEVYNALLSTKKILEQAYNRKFSLSETIQVVNRLSSDTIQRISSARRELDEMIDGRGKASKDMEYVLKSTERFSRGTANQ
jgi:hypothetical protein